MIDFKYLYPGLCGLAKAHQAGTMAGHLGAAVIAGYFFGEDHPDLDEQVHRGIEGELDRVIQGEEAIWFNAKQAGITVRELFEPLPQERSNEKLIPTIAEALAGNIDQTRQSGHNAIFAAIAVRALHDHPDYATPSIVVGIRKLIEKFNSAHPGRGYYGKETGWLNGNQVVLPDDDGPPAYQNELEMAESVIKELINGAAVRRQGFGGLWHVINHAAALAELSRFGYKDLGRKGLAAHHQHVRLWRSLPDVESELGPVTKADENPLLPEYWAGMLNRDGAQLTHRIKTLYGFFTLRRLIEDEPLQQKAQQSLLYLMA